MKIERRLVVKKGWTSEESFKLKNALVNKGFGAYLDAYPEYYHLIVEVKTFMEGATVQSFVEGWMGCFQRDQKGK